MKLSDYSFLSLQWYSKFNCGIKLNTKCFLFFSIFVLSKQSTAQYWALESSKWHIGVQNIGIGPPVAEYVLIEATGDTIMNGKLCKILNKTKFNANGSIQDYGHEYMYEDSGKVYHSMSNSFYTLYDFNAMPGDTWSIAVPYRSWPCATCDTIVNIIVDSVGSVSVQGNILKTIYVHSDTSDDWTFANPIIERIGSAGGLFPYLYGWNDFEMPYLRCYEDSLIFFHSSPMVSCDSVTTDRMKLFEDSRILVFPNPSMNELNIISSEGIVDIFICDLFGRSIVQQKIFNNGAIDIRKYISGIYLYEIRNNQGILKKGKFFRE